MTCVCVSSLLARRGNYMVYISGQIAILVTTIIEIMMGVISSTPYIHGKKWDSWALGTCLLSRFTPELIKIAFLFAIFGLIRSC